MPGGLALVCLAGCAVLVPLYRYTDSIIDKHTNEDPSRMPKPAPSGERRFDLLLEPARIRSGGSITTRVWSLSGDVYEAGACPRGTLTKHHNSTLFFEL
jgi:hypothetical protein